MAILGSLQVRLGLNAATFASDFNKFAKGFESRVKGFQRSMSGVGNLSNMLGGAALGAGLGNIVGLAGNFQQSMEQVAAASDSSGTEMQSLSALALQMGRDTTASAQEAANAMLDLAKAGITPAQMAGGSLAATIQLAATEGMQLGSAAEIMAQQMGAFKLQASDSAAIVDALAGASIASTASVEGIGQALQQSAAVAASSGYSLNETAGAIALFAQNGIKGSDAGTSLKTMLLRLNPATDEAAALMKQYNLKFSDSKGNFLDLTQIAGLLQNRFSKLSESQRQSALQTIFGTDAMRAASIMTMEGAEGLQKYITATEDKNAAEKLSEARAKGFNGAMLRLKNTIASVFTDQTTKSGLLTFLTDAANGARELVLRISNAPPWMFKLGLGISAAAAAAPFLAAGLSSVAGALPILLKGFGMATGILTGPFGIALAVGVTAWVLFKDEILAGGRAIVAWFQGWVQSNSAIINGLASAWSSFVSTIKPLFSALVTAGRSVAGAIIAAFGGDSTSVFASFKEIAGAALAGIVTGATVLLQGLTSLTMWLTTNLPGWSATVGSVATSIIQWFQNIGSSIMEKFGPLFDAWGKAFTATWGLIGSAIGLWGDIAVLAYTKVAGWISQFANWISQTTEFKASVEFLQKAFELYGQTAKKWIDIVVASLSELYNKGAGFLTGLKNKVDDARKALQVFGDAGEKETDRAVGHSWLADLCEIGVQHFQDLIGKGINPTVSALKGLGQTGDKLTFSQGWQLANAPRAIQIDQRTHRVLKDQGPSYQEETRQFTKEWAIALDNSQRAMDDFVRNGRFSFKSLLDGILADIASSALQGAVKGLFSGIAGVATSGGSGGGWGALIGSVVKGITSYDGGGYTGSGGRVGGLDGKGGRLAMLHPQETVVEHTKVHKSARKGSSGKPQVNLSVPINLQPGVSRQELAQILPEVQRNIIKIIPELIQQGGRYASAYR